MHTVIPCLCNSLSGWMSVSHTACWETWSEKESLVEKKETGGLTWDLVSTLVMRIFEFVFFLVVKENIMTVEELIGMLAQINGALSGRPYSLQYFKTPLYLLHPLSASSLRLQ